MNYQILLILNIAFLTGLLLIKRSGALWQGASDKIRERGAKAFPEFI
jgi:hypothetical protein